MIQEDIDSINHELYSYEVPNDPIKQIMFYFTVIQKIIDFPFPENFINFEHPYFSSYKEMEEFLALSQSLNPEFYITIMRSYIIMIKTIISIIKSMMMTKEFRMNLKLLIFKNQQIQSSLAIIIILLIYQILIKGKLNLMFQFQKELAFCILIKIIKILKKIIILMIKIKVMMYMVLTTIMMIL